MQMKAKTDTIAVVLGITTQIPIAWFIWVSHNLIENHWREILEGARLPQITNVALATMQWIPMAAAILIIAGVTLTLIRKHAMTWTFLIVLIEAILVSFVMLAILYPAMTTTYRLE